MKKEIQFALWLVGLGASIIVYAHAVFPTKYTVDNMSAQMTIMDKRIYDIHRWVNPKYKEK